MQFAGHVHPGDIERQSAFRQQRTLLAKKLPATLDLLRQRAHLAAIQREVPIVVISGTLAIDIAKFATHAHEFEQWSTLSRFSDAHECDPDFVCINSAMFKSKPDFSAAPSEGSSSCASKVAASMVEVHGGLS